MLFHPIDLSTFPRGQMFWYFSQMAPTGYSITVNLDVTRLRETLKRANRKFFPTYLYAVHSYDCKPYFFPSVEAGKIYTSPEGKQLLPLSITCHHATTDGYHVDLFLRQLQQEMDGFRPD